MSTFSGFAHSTWWFSIVMVRLPGGKSLILILGFIMLYHGLSQLDTAGYCWCKGKCPETMCFPCFSRFSCVHLPATTRHVHDFNEFYQQKKNAIWPAHTLIWQSTDVIEGTMLWEYYSALFFVSFSGRRGYIHIYIYIYMYQIFLSYYICVNMRVANPTIQTTSVWLKTSGKEVG